jgi:3-dehydroquinate synthase
MLPLNSEVRLPPYLQKITVSYEYPVYFTSGVFDPVNPDLTEAISRKEPTRRHRLAVAVERAVAEAWPQLLEQITAYVEHHRERLELAAAPWCEPGGETAKNDAAILQGFQTRLHQLRLDRQSFVVLVGGGAFLDFGGYAAAMVHRGVRVVRLPTTVLAQGDSGVGVKNGINAFGIKNFFGVFAPPFAVLNDARFLETLSRRDTVAGMAEAVKVALIRDVEFFAWLERHAAPLAACRAAPVAELIRRTAHLHLDHIATSGDPFEFGSARPLDFGHWAAHKLESLTGNRLRHGEAVAIGMALDTLYSVLAGLLAPSAAESILALLEALGFALWDEALETGGAGRRPVVLDGLAEFREHLGGELTVTLLTAIGRGVEAHEIREPVALEALAHLRRRGRRA